MLREGQRATATVAEGDLEQATSGEGSRSGRGIRTRAGARAAALAAIAALGLAAAGCGGSSTTTTTTSTAAASAPAPATSTTTTTTAAAPASESGLSGRWNGQYGGAYNGTFVLNWQQSGSSLSGKITISSPESTLDVNGTLHGSSITFGTVGSLAITYTGTVSGSSMSGTYHTPGGGGSWSASKG